MRLDGPTQVWCRSELAGHLHHAPFNGTVLRIPVIDYDYADMFDIPSPDDPPPSVAAESLELKMEQRCFRVHNVEVRRLRGENLHHMTRRFHLPDHGVVVSQLLATDETEYRWFVFNVDLDTMEKLFDHDRFIPYG